MLAHRWPSICAAYPRVARVATNGRAVRSLCLTLLRVEFAEPCESPLTLVRSYRTVSPSPVTGRDDHVRSIGGLSLLHLFVRSPQPGSRQHPALRSPDFPRHGHAVPRPPGRLTIAPGSVRREGSSRGCQGCSTWAVSGRVRFSNISKYTSVRSPGPLPCSIETQPETCSMNGPHASPSFDSATPGPQSR